MWTVDWTNWVDGTGESGLWGPAAAPGAGWREQDSDRRGAQGACWRLEGRAAAGKDGRGRTLELLRKQSRQDHERQGIAENDCWVYGRARVQRTAGSARGGGK